MATVQEQITAIDQAILRIAQGGQSVTLPTGATYTQANLGELRRLRETLAPSLPAAAGDLEVPSGPGFLSVAMDGAGGDRC